MRTAWRSLASFFSPLRTMQPSVQIQNIRLSSTDSVSTTVNSEDDKRKLPVMTTRPMKAPIRGHREPRQAWLESMRTIEDEKIGIIDLHPNVFAATPRIDLIFENLNWQGLYRVVDYRSITTRSELTYRSNRKPWPQKKTGRARHGNRRSPLFVGGAQSKGPRGPQSHFFILPDHMRLHGLLSSLSVRYAQDDLHIVDSFEHLPTDQPSFLENLVRERFWGDSVLFVNETDEAPVNIAMACDKISTYNIMPVYGLNVWSMMKHDTVVLTLAALEKIEEKLLYQLNRTDTRSMKNPPWNESINKYNTGFTFDEFDPRFQ